MRSIRFLSLWLTLALAAVSAAAPVAIVPAEFAGAVQPQITVSPKGQIHVVFGKDGAIYHGSSPDGLKFSAPVKIGALEKLALGMRRGPRIVASDDLLLVTAISHADGQLHSWLSTDGGLSWQRGEDLNTVAKSAREGLHAAAGDGRGLVATTWLDLRNGSMELWSRVSHDGGRSWQPDVRVYASPDGAICTCCHPCIAIGPGSAITAMWRNALAGSRDLWLAQSTDSGRSFLNPRKLGTGTWKFNACPMDGGSLAIAGDGQPLTAWRRETAIYLTSPQASEVKIADQATQPVIALGQGAPWLVWEEKGALKMKAGGKPAAVLAKHGRAAALANLPDGRVIVAWENTDSSGPALMAEILPLELR